MSEFDVGYPLRRSYLDNIAKCEFCGNFGERNRMVKIEPPNETGYFVCEDCHSKFSWLFTKRNEKR